MSLRVVARVAAKANSVEQVRAILMGVVEPTRREPGCLSYQLLQSQADPTDFPCIEELSVYRRMGECRSRAIPFYNTTHLERATTIARTARRGTGRPSLHSIEVIPGVRAAQDTDSRGRNGIAGSPANSPFHSRRMAFQGLTSTYP